MRLTFMAVCLALTGCGFLGAPRIKSGGTVVEGIKDAGKPATLATLNAGETVALPAGSRITVTETAAVAATQAAPAKPAQVVTEIEPGGPTEWHKTETRVQADTGVVDTTIAAKKVDAAESRPLLYASIAAALAAGFFVWAQYPTPAICCGAACAVFFAAWKLSDLPDWFWAVGLAAVCIGGALYLGHERGHATGLSAPSKDKS